MRARVPQDPGRRARRCAPARRCHHRPERGPGRALTIDARDDDRAVSSKRSAAVVCSATDRSLPATWTRMAAGTVVLLGERVGTAGGRGVGTELGMPTRPDATQGKRDAAPELATVRVEGQRLGSPHRRRHRYGSIRARRRRHTPDHRAFRSTSSRATSPTSIRCPMSSSSSAGVSSTTRLARGALAAYTSAGDDRDRGAPGAGRRRAQPR